MPNHVALVYTFVLRNKKATNYANLVRRTRASLNVKLWILNLGVNLTRVAILLIDMVLHVLYSKNVQSKTVRERF